MGNFFLYKNIVCPLVAAGAIFYAGWGKHFFYDSKKEQQQVVLQEGEDYSFKKLEDGKIKVLNIPDKETLENLIESDMSHVMGYAVDASTPIYTDLPKAIILSEKGSLKVGAKFKFSFDYDNEDALRHIARGLGPEQLNTITSENFKELYDSYNESENKDTWHKNLIEKNPELALWEYNLTNYEAYTGKIAGGTLDVFFTHFIMIEESKNLYQHVYTWGHEVGHTLIHHEMGFLDYFSNMADYTSEKQMIQETVCDIIGEKTADHFFDTHFNHNSEFYKKFKDSSKKSLEFNEYLKDIIADVDQNFKSGNTKKAYELISEANDKLTELSGRDKKYNEAGMAISKVYSCDDTLDDELRALADKLGMEEFVEVAAGFKYKSDVHEAYTKLINN